MESAKHGDFPGPEQQRSLESSAAYEILGLKEALKMIDEGFESDLQTLDALQKFVDQPKPEPDDIEANQQYAESMVFAQEVIANLLPKTERSKDLAQQIRLRIDELESQA